MEAPEKIYLQEPTKVRTEKVYDNDVEYTRTDAFIEKTCKWLKYNTLRELCLDFDDTQLVREFVDSYKEYMKGE